MIKGVNRQMIEVTHTGSPYFERAFLVVRTGSAQPSEETLRRIAGKVVQQAETYAGLRRQHMLLWIRRVCCSAAAAGAGALVMWIVLHLQ